MVFIKINKNKNVTIINNRGETNIKVLYSLIELRGL